MLGKEAQGKEAQGKEAHLTLLELLTVGDKQSLDHVVLEVTTKLPRHCLLTACSSLSEWLSQKEMLTPSQRLAGFAILQQAYSSQPPSSNPFISLLVDVACDEKAESYERGFILQLLGSSGSTTYGNVLKQSAADYIRNYVPSQAGFPPREQLQQQYCSKDRSEKQTSTSRNNRVKNYLPDPDVQRGRDINSQEFDQQPGLTPKIGSGDRDETVSGLLQNLSLDGLRPKRIKPQPPRLPVMEGDLVWLNPDNSHDHGTCADIGRGAVVRDLIAKALKGPLAPAQQEQVLVELAKDSELVYDCGLTPGELPELVENNPVIAVEVLIKLANSPTIEEYFTCLVAGKGVSLHSMEVVNRLTTAVELPTEFVRLYITNCISSCEDIEDTYMQNTLVRHVCVFFQSLIRNRIISVQDMLIEVDVFCAQFDQIKEAAGLLRLLKTLE